MVIRFVVSNDAMLTAPHLLKTSTRLCDDGTAGMVRFLSVMVTVVVVRMHRRDLTNSR